MKDDRDSDWGGTSGDGEKLSDIEYILKLESTNWWYIEFNIGK